ncbi:hypothetical protein [Pedobacter immunditicola]|uniref:hypothetical protein n=1 Tax=Pedobacter immunditicola TaxID=3133440 RepID=UPI0030A31217
MKKTMLAMAVAVGLFAVSCSNKPSEGTHEHEDGTVHEEHASTVTDTTKQEEFKVDSAKTDSTAVHDESKPHTH